jgi:peptidoglycan/LPS O-acetylase OafA/YrhL
MANATRRIPALDGLRGLAILSVLAWHYVASTLPWDTAGQRAGHAALAYAWAGVDLFFVLSGFLIGGILLDHARARNLLAVFYARRALRILPLYWAVLAAYAASRAFLAPHLPDGASAWLHANPHPLWTYLTFGQNIATGLFSPHVAEPGWLNVTWSLAVEEHFYLVVPLAFLALPARLLPWALATIVALGPAVRALVLDRLAPEAGLYVLTPCRVDTIVLGVLCAWAVRRPRVRAALRPARLWAVAVALAAALAAAQVVDVGRAFALFGYSAVGLLSACVLLLALVDERGPLAAVLRSAALQRAGGVAYGLYLLHQPVQGLAHALVLGAAPRLGTAAEAAVTAGAFAASFALAELSWRVLERPLVALGQRLRYASPQVVPANDVPGAGDRQAPDRHAA